jgi:acyl-CoA dehydrogenase
LRSSRLGRVRERANQGLEDAVAWDFSTEPEFQEQLDWVEEFCCTEVEPLDLVFPGAAYSRDPKARALADPLKQQVKDHGLWALFLDRELGGPGFGQLKLALLNEILGRYRSAPVIFGTAAPDTGNMEMLAAYGTEEQKQRWLYPLMNQEIFSAYSMTEPQGGSDPSLFQTRAVRDGEDWVINGEKWFTSAGARADIIFVMCTNGMFVVPRDTAGVEIMEYPALHNHIRYTDVRIPGDHLLGPEDGARVLAQRRLGGGRIHHAMRTVGMCQKALDMMCERALSRTTQGSLLADKQIVQSYVADSYIQLTQFRLYVLYVAWAIDKYQDYRKVRHEIAAVKVLTPQVLHDIVQRSIQVHGALGVSNELPLGGMWMSAPVMGLVDGPTEVHKVTVARQILKRYKPAPGLWPTEHLPTKVAAARERFVEYLDHEVANQ